LPAPWAGQDIGSPVPAGSLSFDENTFTINGGGSDIWNASDHFFFVYQPISGDVDIRARVNSLLAPSDWSKAGVMIRASLDPNAAHGIALVSGSRGTAFQDRPAAGHISVTSQGPRVTAPQWVRLVRTGTLVKGYASSDGTTWTKMGSATVALGASAYVGLAVTSHSPGAWATAALSQVSVIPLGLPAGQHDADIGAPTPPGNATSGAGAYTISAG